MRGDPVQHDARCNRVEVPSNRGEGTRDNLSIKVCFVHCRLQGGGVVRDLRLVAEEGMPEFL